MTSWWDKHAWVLKLLSDLMTEEEKEIHRRDWVYYNAKISNPDITREIIDEAADKIKKEQK